MSLLETARNAINEADAQIAECFEKRMHASEDVIAYKMEKGLPIFDAAREKEVIERNLALITDQKLKPYYVADFPTSFDYAFTIPRHGPYPADIATCGFACSAFARHYSRNLG